MDRLSLLSLFIGGVLPLLVALVTKSSWPEALKALILAVLSAANGVGTSLLNPGGSSAQSIVANAALTFVSGAAVAAGIWKPTGMLYKLESIFIRDVAPVVERELPLLVPGSTAVANPARTVFTSGFDATGTATVGTTQSVILNQDAKAESEPGK